MKDHGGGREKKKERNGEVERCNKNLIRKEMARGSQVNKRDGDSYAAIVYFLISEEKERTRRRENGRKKGITRRKGCG